MTEEVIARVEELGKEDNQPLMEKGTVIEWSPGNIVLDDQEDEVDFDSLINDLQQHHNDDNDRAYVSDDYDGDDDILGSWEAEYSAMEKEEGMMVIDDNIYEEGDRSDSKYDSNES